MSIMVRNSFDPHKKLGSFSEFRNRRADTQKKTYVHVTARFVYIHRLGIDITPERHGGAVRNFESVRFYSSAPEKEKQRCP